MARDQCYKQHRQDMRICKSGRLRRREIRLGKTRRLSHIESMLSLFLSTSRRHRDACAVLTIIARDIHRAHDFLAHSPTAYTSVHTSSPSSRSTRRISYGVVATSASSVPNLAFTAYREFPFLIMVVWTSNRGFARGRGLMYPQERSGERVIFLHRAAAPPRARQRPNKRGGARSTRTKGRQV